MADCILVVGVKLFIISGALNTNLLKKGPSAKINLFILILT